MRYQNHGDRWIIWGVGKIGKNVCNLLLELGEKVECFIDSNKELWKEYYRDIVIQNPRILKTNRKYKICIAVMNEMETIRESLVDEYGYSPYQIFHYLSCIKDSVTRKYKTLYPQCASNSVINQQIVILLACTNGLAVGGIESWNLTFGKLLSEKGKNIKYFLRKKDIQKSIPKYRQVLVDVEDFNDHWCVDQIKATVNVIEKNLPCVLVTNYANLLLISAYIVKLRNPAQLKIVSIVHGGGDTLLNRYQAIDDCVDMFIGVAEHGICDQLICRGIAKDKVKYVVCPVPCPQKLIRTFSTGGEAIKVGYAARLRKNDRDKRPDYLLKLLDLLLVSDIKYQLEVAGNGSFFAEIFNYVLKNHLERQVKLLGEIKREDMPAFWKRQDIFINVSDSEGNSMAMMEAMAQGAVPIVTDVSGVRDSIVEGKNGFVVQCGDMVKMKDYIEYLYHNRNLLRTMGTAAHSVIAEKYEIQTMVQRFEKCLEWDR